MIYAERGNRVKTINECDIQKYVNQGYVITDGMGTVIRDTVPTDVPNLRKAYVEHTEKIKSLQAEIDTLNAKIRELENAKPVKVIEPKAETEVEQKEEQEVAETPKKARKSNKAE